MAKDDREYIEKALGEIAITKDIPTLKDVFLKCINQSND